MVLTVQDIRPEADYEAVRRASQGFEQAHSRLVTSGETYDFVPLTEFCWWAISLDEGLEGVRDGYKSERNSHPQGQVVAGLKHVRNVLGHARLIVTRVEGGLGPPLTPPLTPRPIVAYWIDADALPERPGPNDKNYRLYVEGRRLDETIDAVRRWFGNQVNRMNHESGYYD
jgi:hypothetical protein